MAWARTSIHVQEYDTRHQHDFHLIPYFLESVLEQYLQPHHFSNSAIARRARWVFADSRFPQLRSHLYGQLQRPINIWMYSSSQYKNLHPFYSLRSTICQNIYVSRHVLVYRHINFWTNGSQVFWNGGSTQ